VIKRDCQVRIRKPDRPTHSDAGARSLGEFGIGTNYGITRFTKNMLFDEKMGGTSTWRWAPVTRKAAAKNESASTGLLCDMN